MILTLCLCSVKCWHYSSPLWDHFLWPRDSPHEVEATFVACPNQEISSKPCPILCNNLYGKRIWKRIYMYESLCYTHCKTTKKVKVLVAQSWLTLRDPTDCSPPGSSVQGLLPLEWGAISFSRGSSRPRAWSPVSYVSCIGSWVLYSLRTKEAWNNYISIQNKN